MEKDIRRFLGYLHHVKGWQLKSLGLYNFADTSALFDYLEFLSARGVTTTELKKQATLATQVATFLANLMEANGERDEAKQFREAINTLEYVGKEMSSRLKREKGSKTR
jgi:hypothetical protein